MGNDEPTRTIVITGASDGIGKAAAGILSERGWHVVVVGHSPSKTAAVADALGSPSYTVDFADLSQVRDLAHRLVTDHPRIDVLANNAGGASLHRRVTVDGFEHTFQVNYLAPFLLTHILLPTLLASGASVINTSSVAARAPHALAIDDLQSERHYRELHVYAQSKLAGVLFTQELHRRYGGRGLASAAFHPGVVGSNFGADSSRFIRFAYDTPVRELFTVTPEQGADQLVWLAEGTPGPDWTSGEYYEKRKPHRVRGALDPEMAKTLWERSLELTGVLTSPDGAAAP